MPIIFALLLLIWLSAAVVVVGVCRMAARGDAQLRGDAELQSVGQPHGSRRSGQRAQVGGGQLRAAQGGGQLRANASAARSTLLPAARTLLSGASTVRKP